jgi:Flp pilus assembly protein TadG
MTIKRIAQRTRQTPTILVMRSRARGQALVFVALVLPFLVVLIMTAIEVTTRLVEVAELEDALRQSSRSAIQLLDYAALAQDGQRVDEARVVQTARAMLLTNLQDVRGLAEPPEAIVNRVDWQVRATGGTCTLPGEGHLVAGQAQRAGGQWQVTFATPALCASVRPTLTGLFGWGTYQPQINAAETLDVLR